MNDRESRHLTEEDLVLHHYGEIADRAGTARHLLSCPECRGEYDALLTVLGTVDSLPVPEPPPDLSSRVWQRLEPRLRDGAGSPAQGRAGKRWAAAAALFLMLGAGFLAGRFWPERETSVMASGPIPVEIRERILLVAVGDHLERSQMLLVDLVNEDDAAAGRSISRENVENLVAANRLYRQSLFDAGQVRVASVLEELERVLIDIAHSPPGSGGEALESIRQRVNDEGILFKVRIIGSQVRQKEKRNTGASSRSRI